jgi:hypothetical protein
MPLSRQQLETIRDNCYADDVEIKLEEMSNWTVGVADQTLAAVAPSPLTCARSLSSLQEIEAVTYFEGGGKPAEPPSPPVVSSRARVASFNLLRALFADPSSPRKSEASPSRTHPNHTEGTYGWFAERVASGESIALLSLAGNVAAGPARPAGFKYEYMPRKPDESGEMTKLTPAPFCYRIRGAYGPEVRGGRVVVAERERQREGYKHVRNARLGGGQYGMMPAGDDLCKASELVRDDLS